jgi:hypothetical protein
MLWGLVLENGLKIKKNGNSRIFNLTQRCSPGAMLRFKAKGNWAYPEPYWKALICSLIGDHAGFLLIDKWPTPILFVGSAELGTVVKCTIYYSQYGPQATLLNLALPRTEPPQISSDPWSWQRIVPLTTKCIKI